MSELALQPNTTPFMEQTAADSGELTARDYGALLAQGIEKANALGFSLESAITATGAEESQVGAERDLIVDKAAEIAAWMQLEPKFFDNPGKVVLFTGIADSLAQRADNTITEEDTKLMQDIAYMLAGGDSQTSLAFAAQDPYHKDRYIQEDETDTSKQESEFFESITDDELSRQAEAILAKKGDGSFLQKQRELLGIGEDNETPFVVRVLNAGSSTNIYVANIHEKPDYFLDWSSDMTEEEKSAAAQQNSVADAINEKNRAEKKILEDNLEEYKLRFGEEYGEMLEAAVRTYNGVKEITLRSPYAKALVKYYGDGSSLPEDASARDDVEHIAAIIRHEYGHTQKQLTLGPHAQLGMMAEERKAEFVSGDKHGYLDIKYLFQDLSMASGAMLNTILGNALKEEDALSSFIVNTANSVGLRNTLLLFALKPLPYEKNPAHAKQFAKLNHLVGEPDGSALDIPVREALRKLGIMGMQDRADAWVSALSHDSLKFAASGSYMFYREMQGLKQSSPYRQKAIEKRAAAELSS